MTLQQLALQAVKLYSLPESVVKLNQSIQAKSTSASDLAGVVATDPALAAKVLKLANSALYQCRGNIDSIEKAITLIGTQELSNLAMASAVTERFIGIDKQVLDMQRFWRQSIHAGLAARRLAIANKCNNSEFYFISGLLHRIGLLALLSVQPLMVRQILEHRDSHTYPWYVEESLLGFTIAEVGATLLELWGIPENIIEMVSCQHHPELAIHDPLATRIMHIATMMAAAFDIERYQDSRFDFIAAIDEQTINSLGLNLSDVMDFMYQVDQDAEPILSILSQAA